MCRLRPPLDLGRLLWGAILLAALAGTSSAAAARGEDSRSSRGGEARAEIRFPRPERYAIVHQASGEFRTIYARGDVLFHPQDPARAWTVLGVGTGAVVLRQAPRGWVQAVPVGRPIPGFPGWTVTGTVLLEEVHYRYKVVERVQHPDPLLVALESGRAVLEVEVSRARTPVGIGAAELAPPSPLRPSPPAQATPDGGLLGKIRVQEVNPGLYEVNAADVQAALENPDQALADLAPLVLPTFSLEAGAGYRISSTASDGVLTANGFTLTAPRLAGRAGLQVGDTILSINGRPVDGFHSLYGTLRQLCRNLARCTVTLEVDRRGTRLMKLYRIR